MSGWLSYFSGKRAAPSRDATREAIVDLRRHLITLEKKEDYLNKKIEEEVQKAKDALATGGANGKRVATNALRQKKMHESELEKIAGTRVTLETQVSRAKKCTETAARLWYWAGVAGAINPWIR
jgi:charged multivesicular body protein 4